MNNRKKKKLQTDEDSMCSFESRWLLLKKNRKYARVAQLVEYDLAKVGVAGSSPVSRSFYLLRKALILLAFRCFLTRFRSAILG